MMLNRKHEGPEGASMWPDTKEFTGELYMKDGKPHNITRTYCSKCREILSEFHYGCCGHASSGWGSFVKHECK